MSSVIIRKEKLTEIFNSFSPNVIEVYSATNFSFEHEVNVEFVIVYKNDIEVSKLFWELQKLYNDNAKLYITSRPRDGMLDAKKLIWRKGKWYIE